MWTAFFRGKKHNYGGQAKKPGGKRMTKIKQIIEWVRDDVNEDESMVWSIFNKALHIHFSWLIFLGLPFLLYVLFSFGKLT